MDKIAILIALGGLAAFTVIGCIIAGWFVWMLLEVALAVLTFMFGG